MSSDSIEPRWNAKLIPQAQILQWITWTGSILLIPKLFGPTWFAQTLLHCIFHLACISSPSYLFLLPQGALPSLMFLVYPFVRSYDPFLQFLVPFLWISDVLMMFIMVEFGQPRFIGWCFAATLGESLRLGLFLLIMRILWVAKLIPKGLLDFFGWRFVFVGLGGALLAVPANWLRVQIVQKWRVKYT
eukprot:gnl/Trimastix_PCT/3448.p1 GENE.gnl/Trimastix_PCT/3448~~gnl/Trimastix_PCT/3448.p1  ORF type:complete len:188 (+),score=24.46 gnl/Trimastix_PCT/3448:73-636(+)